MPLPKHDPNPHRLRTGDVLLLRGASAGLLDDLIRLFTGSSVTHVGMVVVDPPFAPALPRGVYVLESSREPFPDAEDHERKFGVQLVSYAEAMVTWRGLVTVRRLRTDRDEGFRQRLGAAHSIVHNRPYDANPAHWIEAGMRLPVPQHTSSFWCSALVAFVYRVLKLLPPSLDTSEVVPKDFADGGRLEAALARGELEPEEPLMRTRAV